MVSRPPAAASRIPPAPAGRTSSRRHLRSRPLLARSAARAGSSPGSRLCTTRQPPRRAEVTPARPLLMPAGYPGAGLEKGLRRGVGTETHQVGAHRALRQHQGALGHQEYFDVGEAGHLLFLLLVPLSLVPLQLAAPAAARRAARLLPLHPSPAAAAAFPLAWGVRAAAWQGCVQRSCVLSPPRAAAAAPVLPGLERWKHSSSLPPPPRSPLPPPPPPSPRRLLLRLGLCQSQGLLAPPAASAAASPLADTSRCHRLLPLTRWPPCPRLSWLYPGARA